MVIERFRNQNAKAIYSRVKNDGRSIPDGLSYEGSWVQADLDRCFQLVECDDIGLLQEWVANWSDLIEFEIVPVLDSEGTIDAIDPLLK